MTVMLVLDTCTEACSVALSDGRAVAARFERRGRGHGQRVLSQIDEVLAELGVARGAIDVVGFGRGPGSFTGVRVGVGVAQGLAFGLDRPLVPVSTLALMAAGAFAESDGDRVITAIDARMGEVYWAAYERGKAGLPRVVVDESVAAPESVALPEGGEWLGAGTGFGVHGEVLAGRLGARLAASDAERLPDARHAFAAIEAAVAEGALISAAEAVPVYLRDRVTG